MKNMAHPERTARKVHGAASRWHTDLAVVAVAVVACYAIASAFDIKESIFAWLDRYERWQADELPLTSIVFAVGLAWYAWRRLRETEAQLRLRRAAEAHAAELLAHNRELAQQLISLQESERLALARELHDELGQRCSAILVETACLRRCDSSDRVALLAAAARTDMAARGLYQGVGAMLRRLRPAQLDALGLVAALQELCESWEERSGIACTFHPEGLNDTAEMPDIVNITVYRITQESLTNVMRHASATRVRVKLVRDRVGGDLHLAISDDGRGMDTTADTRGLGLLGATERAAAIGGRLEVRSRPGSGVQLSLRVAVPFEADAAAALASTEAA